MASQEEFDELKGRLESLEKQVAAGAAPQFTAEELAAFRKVSAAAADFGEFCGINDCFRPRLCSTVCSVCRSCWVPCIVECTCGPCNQGPIIGGGLQRFGGLGG
ncbi:MAG TPA: hypothetical protein PKE46_04255 [Micropruina sp.]|nr:hypothetical protein [Propionibacterium sp.]HMQ36941.1 hypothetical protein [Micropruina sp.]HMR21328.1 hypothetical protein [Micropruina sp.]